MTHTPTQTERELLAALESILAVAFDVAVNGHLMQEPAVLSRKDSCRIYDIARGAILKAQREQRRAAPDDTGLPAVCNGNKVRS